jgi:aminoglycoside phosphotransferase (APT) family kinase protein
MPVAEVDISAELVRRLVAGQHPDLAHLPVDRLANGWDSVLFLVGEDLIARLPRREMVIPFFVNEQRWLPVLGPPLPLPVPVPVRAGEPGLGYPWPWSIVPFLPGQTAAASPPADTRAAAVTMGRFLAALHTPAPPEAPVHTSRGIPLAQRAGPHAENLDLLGDQVDHAVVQALWEEAITAPHWDSPPVWLHGDLHPANILVHQGKISGVIDFIDITAGDPATDLAVAWMLLPAGQHRAFQHAYNEAGQVAAGDALWARAKGWALEMSLVYLAHSADNPLIAGIGRRTLDAVLAASS